MKMSVMCDEGISSCSCSCAGSAALTASTETSALLMLQYVQSNLRNKSETLIESCSNAVLTSLIGQMGFNQLTTLAFQLAPHWMDITVPFLDETVSGCWKSTPRRWNTNMLSLQKVTYRRYVQCIYSAIAFTSHIPKRRAWVETDLNLSEVFDLISNML